ncbi:cyclophilin-like domain-containing protein [Lentinula edodes]|uniref:cyclophilin-like domain-containing protein n=1 Tax=Lentinula edodes TaxID=5353 RepID=UPI001E8E6CC0|nr:cyclophilin-like domain-containing protein [Lentinula edodes]KAH7868291.1 cyclophilin-like domain-containing protein [Lentinula edodes]KAJ3890732.1 cyclophilin-like domain-containing protein [Lentinula edodes]
MVHCFFDICISSSRDFSYSRYTAQKTSYERTAAILLENATNYGLPNRPEELNAEQREILQRVSGDKGSNLVFEPPHAPVVGRLVFSLYDEPDMKELRDNFVKLCTGELGMCKSAPKKPLWYKGVRIHRIVKDYIAQGGDVTRGDGTGGESIYGGKFNSSPIALSVPPKFGSLALANAGPNTNTSQFFVVLSGAESQLARIRGKYDVFGEVVDGWQVLEQLNKVGTADGDVLCDVWVDDCGVY